MNEKILTPRARDFNVKVWKEEQRIDRAFDENARHDIDLLRPRNELSLVRAELEELNETTRAEYSAHCLNVECGWSWKSDEMPTDPVVARTAAKTHGANTGHRCVTRWSLLEMLDHVFEPQNGKVMPE